MATEDQQRRYEVMKALIEDAYGRMDELYRAAAERRGEPPTSITELYGYDRPSYHNPYPADRLPVALDFTPGWCAPDDMAELYANATAASAAAAFDMMAATAPVLTDGMWDLPMAPVSAPGEWTVPGHDEFAAVYAAVDPGNDDTGTWESYKAHRADGFGGYWRVDTPPIDPAFARPIVEDAMAREGINRPRGHDG